MAKKIVKRLKMIAPAGKATPAPPLGPILGQAGINIGEFVKAFNDASAKQVGDKVSVKVDVYEDRTYKMHIQTPPTTDLILKITGIEKGSGKNKVTKAGTITKAQVREVAERKMPDLNAHDIEAAMKIVAGSARSMGIEVK